MINLRLSLLLSVAVFFLVLNPPFVAIAAMVRGTVTDSQTGEQLPSRIYLQRADGQWFFAKPTTGKGSAVEYKKSRSATSVEMHTTLSADPFEAELPPGKYTVTAVHGKEYSPVTRTFEVANKPVTLELALRRWIHMAERGWYSGDTHVHRTVEELPNVMLAEDVNVTFPLTYWVTRAFESPTPGSGSQGDRYGADPIRIDDTHVIYPRNTEYEIFTVNNRRHTLGAVFLLGHKKVLDFGVPPVKPIAAVRDAEGAPLIDLDKHNWPWSMALVPLLDVDLFELANNHIWRTEFHFSNWGEAAAPYMDLQYDGENGSEMSWVRFGFENYYALLNCRFDIQPSAGTANGVHPVPLGFGRVYVQIEGEFEYEKWRQGLKEGRSFVTTGPMLPVTVNDQRPGYTWKHNDNSSPVLLQFSGSAIHDQPLSRIEIVFNGKIVKTIRPANHRTETGAFESPVEYAHNIDRSGWVAVRCWAMHPDGRFRFAHTAPWHVEIPGRPLRPRQEQVEYLIRRVQEEIQRSRGVLPEGVIAEYEEALSIYRDIAKQTR